MSPSSSSYDEDIAAESLALLRTPLRCCAPPSSSRGDDPRAHQSTLSVSVESVVSTLLTWVGTLDSGAD